MSIRRARDGRYVIRYYEDGTKRSSYRQENLGYVERDEALRIYRERTAHAAARKGRALHALTFQTLAASYLESAGRKMAEKSRERAATIIENHLRPVFGSMLVSVIRPFHVERYMSTRIDGGANPSTVNREWNVLKAILNWGERLELIEKNPIRRGSVTGFKVDDAKLIYFEPEEWRRFIAAFEDVAAWQAHVAGVRRLGPVKIGAQGERRYGAGRRPDSDATDDYLQRLRQTVPIFRALLFTGCRLGEILGLRWLDVDMRRNVVSIVQQKTGKQKTLPIEGEFREVLLALPRSIGAAPVFTRPDGRPFATIDVQRAFRIARKLSGIRSELTPHSLRHTFASWLAISGQPLRTIQELLGHADIRMTIRYSHLSPAHLSDAMKTIGPIAEGNGASVAVKTP
jgi:integrase